MSDERVEEFLEHYGVKGMQWGKRKARGSEGRAQRLERQAERRPTRGNTRSAQRARMVADSRAKKKERGAAAVSKAKSAAKTQLPGKTNKADVKALSKMSKGEKAATFLVGGPAGMLVWKAGKISATKNDLAKRTPKEVAARQQAVKALAKMSTGEKIASALFAGPVGMAAYKGGKIIGARIATE